MVLSLIKSSRNKYNYKGVEKVKDHERFFARIVDPETKRRLRIGNFDTPEEAAKAYAEKHYEFEARHGMTSSEKENVSTDSDDEHVNSSPDGSTMEEDNQADHVSDVEEVERSRVEVPLIRSARNKYNYMGAEKVKNCERFFARIVDPVTKRRVRIGDFDTPEEAAKAYTEKHYEFEARHGFNRVSYDMTLSEKENVSNGSDDEHVNSFPDGSTMEEDNQADHVSGVEEVERSRVAVPLIRSARNKYNYLGVRKNTNGNFFIVIADRVTKKRRRFGGFHTPDEAAEAYANKRREIDRVHGFDWVRCDETLSEKEQDENVNSSHDALSEQLDTSSKEEEEEKNESKPKEDNTVPVSGKKELNEDTRFGYFNGVQVFDENGLMVGEFAKIDDLRICEEDTF